MNPVRHPPHASQQTNMVKATGLVDAWLTTNRSCQNRCTFCYAQDTKFDKDLSMKPELAFKLIQVCQDIGIKNILLIGGEPTLYTDVVEIVSKINESGMTPIMITNGRRFSDEGFCQTIVNAGLASINISAKATNRDQYLDTTGSDGFEEMRQGCLNLQRLNAPPNVVLTMHSKTIPSLNEMISEIVTWQPKRLVVEFGCPIVMDGEPTTEGIPDPNSIAECVDQAHTLLNESGLDFYFNYQIPLCLMKEETRTYLRDNDKLFYGCQLRSGAGIIFSHNGDILPCSEFTDQVLFRYGEDYSSAEDLTEIWMSKKRQDLVKAFHSYPSEKCVECADWEICGGGCPIRWLTYDPNEFIRP